MGGSESKEDTPGSNSRSTESRSRRTNAPRAASRSNLKPATKKMLKFPGRYAALTVTQLSKDERRQLQDDQDTTIDEEVELVSPRLRSEHEAKSQFGVVAVHNPLIWDEEVVPRLSASRDQCDSFHVGQRMGSSLATATGSRTLPDLLRVLLASDVAKKDGGSFRWSCQDESPAMFLGGGGKVAGSRSTGSEFVVLVTPLGQSYVDSTPPATKTAPSSSSQPKAASTGGGFSICSATPDSVVERRREVTDSDEPESTTTLESSSNAFEVWFIPSHLVSSEPALATKVSANTGHARFQQLFQCSDCQRLDLSADSEQYWLARDLYGRLLSGQPLGVGTPVTSHHSMRSGEEERGASGRGKSRGATVTPTTGVVKHPSYFHLVSTTTCSECLVGTTLGSHSSSRRQDGEEDGRLEGEEDNETASSSFHMAHDVMTPRLSHHSSPFHQADAQLLRSPSVGSPRSPGVGFFGGFSRDEFSGSDSQVEAPARHSMFRCKSSNQRSMELFGQADRSPGQASGSQRKTSLLRMNGGGVRSPLLPLSSPIAAPANAAPSSFDANTVATVVMVEPDRIQARTMKRVLLAEGILVVHVNCPKAGLQYAQEHRSVVNLVVCHYLLPTMSAVELSCALNPSPTTQGAEKSGRRRSSSSLGTHSNGSPTAKAIPVVAIGGAEFSACALAGGICKGYVKTPVESGELVRIVKTLLGATV